MSANYLPIIAASVVDNVVVIVTTKATASNL